MPTTTTPEPRLRTAKLCNEIHAFSREAKEQLINWLQDELDGKSECGRVAQLPVDPPGEVKSAWRSCGGLIEIRIGL